MAHKSFRRAQNLDPLSFDLPGENGQTVEFRCEDEIPSGVIFAITEVKPSSESDDEGKSAQADEAGALDSVMALFRAAIVDEQLDQFMGMVKAREKGKGIPVSMLMEIATWLGEQYSSRPTGLSSDSGPSVKPSGQASTAGALHAVTTYSKPEPVGATT